MTKTASHPEYCLANGVTIVKAKNRCAMYDLPHNRLMLISHELARCFEGGRLKRSRHRSIQRDVGTLIDRGYIQHLPYSSWRPFDLDLSFPYAPLPPTLTLIVWLSKDSVDYLNTILYELVAKRRTRHAIFLCCDTSDSLICTAAKLAQRSGISYEIGNLHTRHIKTVIYNPRGTAIGSRVPPSPDSNLIDVSYGTFARLHRENESCGQLYINASAQLSSHWDEEFYFYRTLNPLQPQTYIEDINYRVVSENTKDQRDICAQCELRYACRYSYTARCLANCITSGPAACSYSKNVM